MVVVAILALCASIVGFSLSSVWASQAKRCAREMDAFISKAKIGAMSRAGDVFIEFSSVGGRIVGAYYEGDSGVPLSTETFSTRKISVTYRTDTDPDVEIDLESKPLRLSFYKDTGALVKLGDIPGVPASSYGPNAYCQALTVSGGGVSLEIRLYPLTGSHELKGVS